MISISSLGSCRIATPLRLMREAYGYKINNDRTYGFCHTSSEAVQMMKFMKGEYVPSASIWPLIAKDKSADAMLNKAIVNSDAYIVEISSSKRLMIGDECIQLNYLTSSYQDFFSCAERVKGYWRLASNPDYGTELSGYLNEHWSNTCEKIEQSKILAQVRRTMMTEDQIRDDIRQLIDGLEHVLFVTHVNARTTSNEVIASRSSLITSVKTIVAEEKGVVYDPTSRMLEIGQNNAIEDHSDSLAHYTELFAKIIFSDWYDAHLSYCIDQIAQLEDEHSLSKVNSHYQSLIITDRIYELPKRLEKIINNGNTSPQLFEINAHVNTLLGKDNDTLETLKHSLSLYPDNIDLLQQHFELMIRKESYEQAANTIEKLESLACHPSIENIFSVGEGLLKNNNPVRAVSFLEITLSLNNNHYLAAKRIADILSSFENITKELLTPTTIQLMTKLLPPLMSYHLDLTELDFKVDSDQDDLIDMCNKEEFFGYVYVLLKGEKWAAASGLLNKKQSKDHCSLESLAKADTELTNVANLLLTIALKENSLTEKAKILHYALIAFPLLRELRIAARDNKTALLHEIKTLYKNKDITALQALKSTYYEDVKPIFELEFLLAKLSYATENYEMALQSSIQATLISPNSSLAQLTLMRSAIKCGEFNLAKTSAEQLCSCNEPNIEKIQNEAQLQLQRLPRKCFVAARGSDDPLHKFELLKIAIEDPELVNRCNSMKKVLSRTLITEVIQKEKNHDPELIPFALKVDVVLPNEHKIMLILGRNLVKQRLYSKANPYWEKLIKIAPNNMNYLHQFERCAERSSLVNI